MWREIKSKSNIRLIGGRIPRGQPRPAAAHPARAQ